MYNEYIVGGLVGVLVIFVCLWIGMLPEMMKEKSSKKLFIKIGFIAVSLALIFSFISPFFFTNASVVYNGGQRAS